MDLDMEVDHPIQGSALPPNVHIWPNVPADKPAANWLRMVCVSDTHNMTDANNYCIPEADVLVHSGDFTKMGTTQQIEQFIAWLKSLTHIPLKLIIAGNHEVLLDGPFYEKNWQNFHSAKEDHQAAVELLNNAGHGIVYLNNSSYEIDGPKILYKKFQKLAKTKPLQEVHEQMVDPREGWISGGQGYKVWGSPWQPEFCNWAFNETRGRLKYIWQHIPEDTEILITHGPPQGQGDIIEEDANPHVGCQELLERLNEVRPLYHVFGHIHQGYGVSAIQWGENGPVGTGSETTASTGNPSPRKNDTVCINASTCNIKYRPLNMPIIVDLPPK